MTQEVLGMTERKASEEHRHPKVPILWSTLDRPGEHLWPSLWLRPRGLGRERASGCPGEDVASDPVGSGLKRAVWEACMRPLHQDSPGEP
jgi:hypothetical protein